MGYRAVWWDIVGYGGVWWGMVRCGAVWCGVVRCGGVWRGVVRCGGVWWGVVGCGGVRWGMVRYGGVWWGMVGVDVLSAWTLPLCVTPASWIVAVLASPCCEASWRTLHSLWSDADAALIRRSASST